MLTKKEIEGYKKSLGEAVVGVYPYTLETPDEITGFFLEFEEPLKLFLKLYRGKKFKTKDSSKNLLIAMNNLKRFKNAMAINIDIDKKANLVRVEVGDILEFNLDYIKKEDIVEEVLDILYDIISSDEEVTENLSDTLFLDTLELNLPTTISEEVEEDFMEYGIIIL